MTLTVEGCADQGSFNREASGRDAFRLSLSSDKEDAMEHVDAEYEREFRHAQRKEDRRIRIEEAEQAIIALGETDYTKIDHA